MFNTSKNKSCCVRTCRNSIQTKPHLSYLPLPTNEPRRSEWLLAIGREDLLTIHRHHFSVCEEHFESEVFIEINGLKQLMSDGTTPLEPTLSLPKSKKIDEDQEIGLVSTTTKTEQTTFSEDMLKKIEEYKEANNMARIILAPELKSKLLELSKQFSTCEMHKIIQWFENLSTTPPDSELYKVHCTNLYTGSPNVYRLLQSAIDLPEPNTLLINAPIMKEINENFLKMVGLKVAQMTGQQLQCIAVVDSMPLTPHVSYNVTKDNIEGFQEINGEQNAFLAERALVVILRGLVTNWRLPVGYALLQNSCKETNKLSAWLITLFSELCDLGLSIRTVSFVSSVEAKYFERHWPISIDKPYLLIKKHKLHIIGDAKTLLNEFRDEFRLHDILYEDDIAKFQHIEDFFNLDKNSPYRFAPKLSEAHIYSSRKDVCASEVFTKAVASGISSYVDRKLITKNAKITAQLIDKISDIIFFINSTNVPYENNQSVIESLDDMQTFVSNLVMMHSIRGLEEDITGESNFIRGMLLSLRACLSLFKISHKDKITFKPINFQNRGTSDDCFKQVRLRCEGSAKPTAAQFMAAYEQLFILGLYLKHEREIKEITYQNIAFARTEVSKNVLDSTLDLEPETGIKLSLPDFSHIDRAERNSSMYVSAFLLKKCRDHHWYCNKFKN